MILCGFVIPDDPVKSLYSVSFRKFRVDSIGFAGKMPALPALFAASSFLTTSKKTTIENCISPRGTALRAPTLYLSV